MLTSRLLGPHCRPLGLPRRLGPLLSDLATRSPLLEARYYDGPAIATATPPPPARRAPAPARRAPDDEAIYSR